MPQASSSTSSSSASSIRSGGPYRDHQQVRVAAQGGVVVRDAACEEFGDAAQLKDM
jgi:hypothetical protein